MSFLDLDLFSVHFGTVWFSKKCKISLLYTYSIHAHIHILYMYNIHKFKTHILVNRVLTKSENPTKTLTSWLILKFTLYRRGSATCQHNSGF